MRSYFAVLGVPETASEKELRAAFVRRAKQLHPDLNRSMSVEEAQRRFIELKAAYDCLMDAEQRRIHIQELRAQQFQHVTEPLRRAKWARKRPRWPTREEFGLGGRASPVDLSNAMSVWQHSKWEEFVKDLEMALAKAYWGPVFEGGAHDYPDCFEAEERSDLDHAHVLQVVCGRQLLGHVQASTHTPLPSPTLAYLFGKEFDDLAAGVGAAKRQLRDPQAERLREGQMQSQSRFSSWSAVHMPSVDFDFDFSRATHVLKDAFKVDEDDEIVDEVLELHWQGSLAARGHRRVSRKHRDWHAIQFEVLQDNNWVVECHLARMRSMLGRNRYVFLNSKMEETHRVVVWWTPGVHHAYIFNKQGFCETKMSKARLANSKYWLFEPREATHDVGGWYFERHPLAHRTDSALHPSVSMLWAGFRTLDHQHARLQPLSARATSWLRSVKRLVAK